MNRIVSHAHIITTNKIVLIISETQYSIIFSQLKDSYMLIYMPFSKVMQAYMRIVLTGGGGCDTVFLELE